MVRWHEARAVPAGSPRKRRGGCPGLSGSCPLRTRAVKVRTSRLLQFSDSLAAKREAPPHQESTATPGQCVAAGEANAYSRPLWLTRDRIVRSLCLSIGSSRGSESSGVRAAGTSVMGTPRYRWTGSWSAPTSFVRLSRAVAPRATIAWPCAARRTARSNGTRWGRPGTALRWSRVEARAGARRLDRAASAARPRTKSVRISYILAVCTPRS
jgi:hypothetical protein